MIVDHTSEAYFGGDNVQIAEISGKVLGGHFQLNQGLRNALLKLRRLVNTTAFQTRSNKLVSDENKTILSQKYRSITI